MSESLRQNNLFLNQNWQVIYQAMSQVSFASYDYDTIRQALITYIQLNYPEDFNDWIDNSEMVSIIELLAYLASSLSFRIDLNIRENFIDTATRRESILRLARLISYQPRRCIAGQGLIKLVQVQTDQNVYDSNGKNLINTPINWNDANNPDWFEQFILVLNAAFINGNPYGKPVKQGTVANILTQRYDFNNTLSSVLAFPFSSIVSGQNMNFEFCNVDFTTASSGSIAVGSSGYFSEKDPNIFNPYSIVYRNDGNGYNSPYTGFFALFKQGSFGYSDFILDTPVPNRVIDIGATNINNSDVWVQTIDDNGVPIITWTKVPALPNSNLVYNDIDQLTRNIFQVITTDVNGNDSISIAFSDGTFGNIPVGRVRVYYRTSNNLTYSILPQDLSGISLGLSYASSTTSVNNIYMQYALASTVSNSLTRETSLSVQQNAPATFYTQNRMVNGEDYNLFPLRSSEALKVQATNRIYSGQNRFIDINDPTGLYQDTKIFSNDGILYTDSDSNYTEIYSSSNLTPTQVINTYVQPVLNGTFNTSFTDPAIRDFYIQNYPKKSVTNYVWVNSAKSSDSNTSLGYFELSTNYNNPSGNQEIPIILPDTTSSIRLGSYILFSNGTWGCVLNEGNTVQTSYLTLIYGNIPTGTPVVSVIPSFRNTLTTEEVSAISSAISQSRNFGITFQSNTNSFNVISQENLAIDSPFSLQYQGDQSMQNLDSSWLIQMKWVNGEGWQLTSRGLEFIFESLQDVRFYFINTKKIVDLNTGLSQQDFINVLSLNPDPITGLALGHDYPWQLIDQVEYADGYLEPRRVRVSFWTQNSYNVIEFPDQFSRIVNPLMINSVNSSTGVIDPSTFPYVFYMLQTVGDFDYWNPTTVTRIYSNITLMTRSAPLSSSIWNDGDVVYIRDQQLFLKYQSSPLSFVDVTSQYKAVVGRNDINYLWQHFADNNDRIDPAIMNIIDIYVLTSSYDTAIRNWIANNNPSAPEPTPPEPEDLRSTFSYFENYKMMTDQIVWHPVKYKLLFGAAADSELQVTFKVVKNAGLNVTDSELKSMIRQSINTYFSLVNWGFGQTFFFTELAAYIHQQNPAMLSSIVLVPLTSTGVFGDLFEISCDSDEIFLSCAEVTDIQIVTSLTHSELRS